MRARPLVISGAALISGCSLIYAGDLDGAREVGILPDSGSSSSSGGSSEGGANDGGGPVGGDAGEAGIPTGCATYQPPPKFCEDFDKDGGLAGWDVNDELGQTSTQTFTAFSPPWAAKAVMHGGTGCHYDRIQRTFDNVGANRVTASFRLRLQSPWPDSMAPFVIDLFTPDAYCAGLFYVKAADGMTNGVDINVQSGTKPDEVIRLDGYPSTDDWSEVTVNVTARTGGGATFEVTFVDPDGFSVSTKHDFLQCPVWKSTAIHMGVHCDSREATMFYDDIRLDWE